VRNWYFNGSGNYLVNATKSRAYQYIGEWVCHYGRVTGYGCGYIMDLSVTLSSFIPGSTATYIRVWNPIVDMAEPGDSGGPWFSGNTAYGVMVAHQIGTNNGYYMAVNYFDALNVNVYTGKETYLPDVRNKDGWLSTITVRNGGTSGRRVSVIYLDNAGNYIAGSKDDCLLAPNATCSPTPPSNFEGSAIVDGSEDLSVVVFNRHNGSQAGETRVTDYNGIASGGLDVGWNQTGTTLWAPALKRSLYGRSGQVYLLNTGSVATPINITLRAQDNGASYTCTPIASLGPGARTTWTPAACGAVNLPVNKLYGAQFTASAAQPLAAVVVEENDGGGGIATTNLFRMGGAVNYAPVVKHSFWNHSATIVVQNIGAASDNVTAVYRDRDDNDVYTQTLNLAPGSSSIFTLTGAGAPANTIAAARIAASGNTHMIATMYENRADSNWRMQSNGFTAGSQTVILPRLYKAASLADMTGLVWTSGFQVQNVGGGDATIQLQYYDVNGNPLSATHPPVGALPIPAHESVTYNLAHSSLLTNFVGSALITANQPIVVTVNATASGAPTLDASMSYNGVNR